MDNSDEYCLVEWDFFDEQNEPVFINMEDAVNISTNPESKEYIYIFRLEKYFKEIWQSYGGNLDKVWKQFHVDYPRHDTFVNDIKYEDPNLFLEHINALQKSKYQCLGFLQYVLLGMICSQSSFALLFEVLVKACQKEIEGLYLVDMNKDDKRLSVYVDSKHTGFSLRLCKQFVLLDIEENTPKFKVESEMHFDLLQAYDLSTNPIGILTWIIV